MLRKMMCCVAFVGVALSASTLSADTWNYNSDYSTSLSSAGVFHNWTVGYDLGTTFNVSGGNIIAGNYGQSSGTVYRWVYNGTDTDSYGTADKAIIGAPFQTGWNFYYEPNQTYLMCGMKDSGNAEDVRWTCPADGTYAISSTFGSALTDIYGGSGGGYGDTRSNYVVGVKQRRRQFLLPLEQHSQRLHWSIGEQLHGCSRHQPVGDVHRSVDVDGR